MAVQISGSYGINKDIRAESKIGWVTLRWLGSLAVCEFPTFMEASKFPHSQIIQMILFVILNLIFTFFMISSPSTNPGKMMWQVIYASLSVRTIRYRSIDYHTR